MAVPNRLTALLNVEQASLRLNALSDLPLEELLAVVENENASQA